MPTHHDVTDAQALAQQVKIDVVTHYLSAQSKPTKKHYVFGYTITIENNNTESIQLMDRHWKITDTNDQLKEIQGDGVIGKQPIIEPGESYTYSSGAILDTEAGTMEGIYGMHDQNGERFEVAIPLFVLIQPHKLH